MKKWGDIIRSAHSKRHGRIINFDIDIKYAWDLYVKQNGYCVLSGLPIDFSNHHTEYNTASLDRIDSKCDYTCDNVWWLHKDINRMKWKFKLDRFVALCKLVVFKNKEIV